MSNSRSPSIVFAIGGFPLATQMYIVRDIVSLKMQGWRVHVIATHEPEQSPWDELKAVGFTRNNVSYANVLEQRITATAIAGALGNLKLYWHLKNIFGMKVAATRLGFFSSLLSHPAVRDADVFHGHWTEFASTVAHPLASYLKRAVSCTVHEGFLEKIAVNDLISLQDRLNGFIFVSHQNLILWKKLTGVHKLLNAEVIYNGVDMPNDDLLLAPQVELGSTIRLITVGRCEPIKNHMDVVLATAQLLKSGIKVSLTIVGGGSCLPAIRDKINQLGIQDHVHLLGKIRNADVLQALIESDIFIMASQYESFGVVTTEAMAAALPVVATNTGGSLEIVVENQTGLFFEPNNIDCLIIQLKKLCRDAELRRRLGTLGRKRVEKEFSHQGHMGKSLEFWAGLIKD